MAVNVHLIFLLKNHWKYHFLSPTLCHQNLRKGDADIQKSMPVDVTYKILIPLLNY